LLHLILFSARTEGGYNDFIVQKFWLAAMLEHTCLLSTVHATNNLPLIRTQNKSCRSVDQQPLFR